MLNLAYPIDDTVNIDGTTYTLDLSFDNVLRLFDMLNDKEIDDATQIHIGLQMLLGVCFICDVQTQEKIFFEVFKNTIGKDAEKNRPVDLAGNPLPHQKEEKIYSIKEDAEYIFASFYQDYGIDLYEQQGKLHWYKFQAMLSGLRPDTKFKEVIGIRDMELPKGSAKERAKIRKLKEQYALKGDD